MTNWEKNALMAQKDYGIFVDWNERFYLCPDCGEPIYEADWSEEELDLFFCPICEGADEEEYFDDLESGFDPYMGEYTFDC